MNSKFVVRSLRKCEIGFWVGECMDGWIDACWIDGWMDGIMDGRPDGRTTDGWMDGWIALYYKALYTKVNMAANV